MMFTETPYGIYPYAGVPWCSTLRPRLHHNGARGVLRYLAAHQAMQLSAEKDAEPGKILHQIRLEEMAALQEIPFDRYYGSTDATPFCHARRRLLPTQRRFGNDPRDLAADHAGAQWIDTMAISTAAQC